MTRKLIIGISGASGSIYGIQTLQAIRGMPGISSHLIISNAARLTISQETNWTLDKVKGLADVVHNPGDIGAPIASGSFKTMGMIAAPCSIKSLSAIVNCYDNNLLSRSANVQLKEGRPVLLMIRETPLHFGHIRLMKLAAMNNIILFPPVPAFYNHPQTIDDIVKQSVGRALDRLGIENDLFQVWEGLPDR